jgi:hypothetical protein
LGPDSVTVLPETEPTSPNARSLPSLPSLLPWPAAPGVGLGVRLADVVDEDAGLLLVVEVDGVADEPQAASESAVNPARATAVYRDT